MTDMIELSDDSRESDTLQSFDTILKNKNNIVDSDPIKPAPSGSPSLFDYYNDKIESVFCKSDGDSQIDVKFPKLHDISSSDNEWDDINLDVDSGFDYDLSQCATSSTSTSQSSQLQDKDVSAANVLEKSRKRMEKESAKAEKEKSKEEKRRVREERQREKIAAKELKKEMQYKRNQMKPNECLKYMCLEVDENLFRTVLCSKAVESFPHIDVKISFKQQPIKNSITWTRAQLDGSVKEEDWIAIMWPAEDIAKAISEKKLVSIFRSYSTSLFPGKTILLLIFSMDHYHRKSQNYFGNRNKKNVQLNKYSEGVSEQTPLYITSEEIEMGLVELQLIGGICHRHFNGFQDFADILADFTRAIAEIPYKCERQEAEKEMGWYARSANKNCVRANKDMQGLDRLWIQQLSMFNNSNVDIAKAISLVYETPSMLMEAYENCTTQTERELLLQNIQVKRSGSASAMSKRLGPELSKKICITFTEINGDVKLSSKSK